MRIIYLKTMNFMNSISRFFVKIKPHKNRVLVNNYKLNLENSAFFKFNFFSCLKRQFFQTNLLYRSKIMTHILQIKIN